MLNFLEEMSLLKQISFSNTDKGCIYVKGVCSNLRDILALSVFDNKNPVIYVLKDEMQAKSAFDRLSTLNKNVFFYPKEPLNYKFIENHSSEITSKRVKIITNAIKKKKQFIITSIDAICERRVFFNEDNIYTFKVGDIVEIEDLIKTLNFLGYEKESVVTGEGAYQIKGGIVDLFVMGSENPIRIEFFDDEIDSIRTFDVNTGKSIKQIKSFILNPAFSDILDFKTINKLNEIAKKSIENYKKEIIKNNENNDELLDDLDNLGNKIVDNSNFTTNYIYSLNKNNLKSIMDIPKNPIIILEDLSYIKNTFEANEAEYFSDLMTYYKNGKILKNQMDNFFEFEEIENKLKTQNSMIFYDFSPRSTSLSVKKIVDIKSVNNISYTKNLNYLFERILSFKKDDYKIIVTYKDKKERENLERLFDNYKISYGEKTEKGQIAFVKMNIISGFEMLKQKLFVISYQDILNKFQSKKKTKSSRKKEKAFFSEIEKGDYVVHESYGIGRYLGLVNMEAAGTYGDYLEIQYAGDDKLYVASNKMNLVQKYIGTKDAPPKLNKLNSKVWENTKNKTKKAIKELASEYITLYAKRESMPGFAFSKDTTWQEDFENQFEYELTADQAKCIEEIKIDMEKPHPMDRLLCGDVGFGKTEVALRCVFKACMDSKQCAVLVPTTVLALQHYKVFLERFKNFPINIEMLSRFKSPKEEREIINKINNGTCDIVIGTHKLLSDNVRFKNLGFLVIDEEQRFGVTHKEKLKLLKENVDTLTLSATPIPRTLNMSLIGVRDLSTIEQPPRERKEVETYVMEYDDLIIKDAIKKELQRGGQVFFVYNNVQNATKICRHLEELVPGARITYANGQMKENELEQTMIDFLDKKYDILVCTSIIENGLNILNANTMIIKEGNNLGLSQLYQLRGRVGRSDKNAYAYITYPKNKTLNENAMKRLKAINEFTRFGSGFQIAMRDLQIRGAGSILGANQHGHFANVGYEMYSKLLKEALEEEKGEKREEKEDTAISLKVDAFIPSTYIEDEKLRILTYKEIASIQNEEEKIEIIDNLIDIYGDIDTPLENLIEISHLKANATKKGILKIAQNNSQKAIYVDLDKEYDLSDKGIDKLYDEYRLKLIKNPNCIRIMFPIKNNIDIVKYVKKIIEIF